MGGGVYLISSLLYSHDCEFNENSANKNGGAICLENSPYVDIGSDFYMNQVGESPILNYPYSGGAISATKTSSGDGVVLDLDETTFDSNSSIQNGGAISGICDLMDFEECCFTGNYTIASDIVIGVSWGGAIHGGRNDFVDGGQLKVRDCVFSSNFIDNRQVTLFEGYGGAIGIEILALDIFGTLFEDNGCEEIGGEWCQTESGGAIYCDLYLPVGIEQNTVSNCVFSGNASSLMGGAMFLFLSGDPVLEISECQFVSNGTTCDQNGPGWGGAIYFDRAYIAGRPDPTLISNCLFTDCSAYEGAAIYSYDEGLEIISCTIADCHSAPAGDGYEVLINNSFNQNLEFSISSTVIAYGLGYSCEVLYNNYTPTISVHHCDFFGNQYDWGGNIAGFEGILGNITSDPQFIQRFTPTGVFDYNVMWNSPCLDAGDVSLNLEYDLTICDIGWKTKYSEVKLDQPQYSSLDVGWYYIDEGSVLLAANELVIPEGTIIKVAEGAKLELYAAGGAQPPSITVGSLDGRRTAIVGKLNEEDPGTANMIFFDGTISGQSTPSVTLAGVLFNYNSNTGLAFSNCEVEVASPEVQLQQYFAGWISFTKCSGSLTDFDFASAAEPYVDALARVSCFNSDIHVVGCTFRPPTTADYEGWSLQIFGSKSQSGILLQNNDFLADPLSGESVTPLLVEKAPVVLVNNEFGSLLNDQAFPVTIINQHNATLHMKYDARNVLYGNTPDPLIYMDRGELNLYCGYNDFRQQQANPPQWAKFVEDPNPPISHIYNDWTHNFWGREIDCNTPMDEGLILLNELVPIWVDGDLNSLPACDWGFTGCDPFPGGGGQALFESGLAAEQGGDFGNAVTSYSAVLADFPESTYTNESVLRVKAIALDTDYGVNNCETLQSALLTLADSTAIVAPELATLERSAAWCIHAMHIDPGYAASELTALRDAATTSTSIKCLDLALLEIQTYPPPGGLYSAPTAEQRIASAIYYIERVEDVLHYSRPQLRGEENRGIRRHRSQRPQKVELLGCYPNPFNPSTRINYRLGRATAVKIQIYNLRGQLVTILLDEHLDAGLHQAVFQPDDLAAGIYFISIQTPSFRQVEKVLFVK